MYTRKRSNNRSNKISVLVVDDSDLVIDIVKFSLRNLPVEVIGADNPKRATKYMENRRFSMIITDIKVPGINGLEFVAKLREKSEYKNIPVIVISGYEEEHYYDDALAIGAVAYLQKPFAAEEIAEIVLIELQKEYRRHLNLENTTGLKKENTTDCVANS